MVNMIIRQDFGGLRNAKRQRPKNERPAEPCPGSHSPSRCPERPLRVSFSILLKHNVINGKSQARLFISALTPYHPNLGQVKSLWVAIFSAVKLEGILPTMELLQGRVSTASGVPLLLPFIQGVPHL